MLEQKSITIGTTVYKVTLMDAFRATALQTKLFKLVGGTVLTLVGSKKNLQEQIKVLVPALMENFDDAVANDIIKMLFEKDVFTGHGEHLKVVDFSTHFVGKVAEMWQLAAFIIGVNLGLGEYIESISRILKEEVKSTLESST